MSQLCHASITTSYESDLHKFHRPLLSVFSLFVPPRPLTVALTCLLPTLAETRTNNTVMLCVNHLLSLADWPLLGERATNCASLVIFSEKVANNTQCTSLVLQHSEMVTDLTNIYSHEQLPDHYFKAIIAVCGQFNGVIVAGWRPGRDRSCSRSSTFASYYHATIMKIRLKQ